MRTLCAVAPVLEVLFLGARALNQHEVSLLQREIKELE